MNTFCEDDDFVAVRRPKRKLIPNEIPLAPSTPPGVSEDPNFLVPQVKKRKVNEEKASDVDIVDRNILKNIRVPKKVVESNDYLQRINLQSKEFVREIREVISRSQKNKDYTPFEIRTCYLVENRELQKKYTAKRLSLKNDGLKSDSCSDNYGFCFFQEFGAVREMARNGVKVGNVKRSMLGTPACGVTLSLHADNLCGQQSQFGWLIICKFLRGRPNFVPIDENPLDPQPGYDCHLPQKSSVNGKLHSVADLSQVYLYQYSEDFDLMDYPVHVLPTAVIQIAAISAFKTITKKMKMGNPNRSFGTISPLITPKPLMPPKWLPEEPSGDIGDFAKKAPADPEAVRAAVSAAGNRHSSGGIIVGTCLIRVPIANSLTAEAHIVSLADCMPHMPFGSVMSSLTFDRFINLEDLYTTIFKDGSVKLSITSEIFVEHVGFFNYFRVFLTDSCSTKRPMMNFTNYLRTTNKACVLASHLNCLLILFPDSQMAHDFGLPKPDPLAQPHFLNLVSLSALPRHHFYVPMIAHKPNEVESNSGTLSSIWRSATSTSLVHRFLRFSIAQQGEAQRLYLRRQAEKASTKGGPSSKFPKQPLFTYKPVTTALDEGKSSHRSSKSQKQPLITSTPSPIKPASDSLERVSSEDVEKDDDDDEDDILAVLDTIDKVDLDESSSSKTEQKPKDPANPLKEVFHDPPASPNSVLKTKRSEKVPVVEHTPFVRKEPAKADKAPPKPPQDFQRSLMNSVQDLKTIMSNLKARIATQNGGTEASPTRGTTEDSGIGATPTPETPPKKSETDSQSVMKSSKDWYWFYMKNQTKESEDNDEAASNTPESPAKKSERKDPSPPRKTRLLPTPPKRQPLLQHGPKPFVAPLQRDSKRFNGPATSRDANSFAVPPLMQRDPKSYTAPGATRDAKPFSTPHPPHVSSFPPPRHPEPGVGVDYNHRQRPRDWQQPDPSAGSFRRPPLLSTRQPLLPHTTGTPFAAGSRPPRPPPLLPRTGATLLRPPAPPRPGSSVYAPPDGRVGNTVAAASKDVDLRELSAASFDEPNNFLTSKYDVDMRVPPAQFSRTTVYDPQRRMGPGQAEPARPVKRISTYEPGRGFQ